VDKIKYIFDAIEAKIGIYLKEARPLTKEVAVTTEKN